MVSALIGLLIFVLVAAVVLWVIRYLGLPDMVQRIAVVVLVVLFLCFLLSTFGLFGPQGRVVLIGA